MKRTQFGYLLLYDAGVLAGVFVGESGYGLGWGWERPRVARAGLRSLPDRMHAGGAHL